VSTPRAGAGESGCRAARLVFAGLLAGSAGAALPAQDTQAIEVVSAVAPAPPPGAATMAVYLQLRNLGDSPDALVTASTPVAG
jgi:copper(I)-binding protein